MPKPPTAIHFDRKISPSGRCCCARFVAPGEAVEAELARTVADDECIDSRDDQGADRQHGEEGPPTGRDRQGDAEREIHGDGEAVGGEDDADHRATPALRKPAEDQLHVADEDAGVKEADHEPEYHELRVTLHEHLKHHADAGARKPDQQHVARRHRPADRRPHHHADAVGQRKDALCKTGLGGIELEALGHERQYGREGIPVRGEKYLAEDGERQHAFLPPGYPTAVALGDGRPSCCQRGHHRFSRFACRWNRRSVRRAAAGSSPRARRHVAPPPADREDCGCVQTALSATASVRPRTGWWRFRPTC